MMHILPVPINVRGEMRFLAKNNFSKITFSILTHMYFDRAISKKYFLEKIDQKGTFWEFCVKNTILGHIWPIFVITASYHPIKVP
jgi:hypothetical protein